MVRECQFNPGVDCDSDECYHCGWDPAVSEARREAFVRHAAGEKLYKVPFTGYCEVYAKSLEDAAEKAEDIEKQFFAFYDYGDPICLEDEETTAEPQTPKRKLVQQLTTDDELVKEWPSINEAAAALNGNAHSISNCICGRSRTAIGYKWRYAYA